MKTARRKRSRNGAVSCGAAPFLNGLPGSLLRGGSFKDKNFFRGWNILIDITKNI